MPIKERINVLLLNDAGTGFPEKIEVPVGKKLEEFLNEYVEDFTPEEYHISNNVSDHRFPSPRSSPHSLFYPTLVHISPTFLRAGLLPSY